MTGAALAGLAATPTPAPTRSPRRRPWAGAPPGRPGPTVGVTALLPGDASVPRARLLIERALSLNPAAAGADASLLTMA